MVRANFKADIQVIRLSKKRILSGWNDDYMEKLIV